MSSLLQRLQTPRTVGLVLVVGLHAAALWGLMQHRLIPVPEQLDTLFVHFITPPKPKPKPPAPKPEPPKPKPPKPKPVKLEKPKPPEPHRHIVVEAPVLPTEYVAPPPPPEPSAPVIVEAPPPAPAEPITLSGELALACPNNNPPAYPRISKRMGETGKTVLRVEIDTEGRIDHAEIVTSSGYRRLDDAALTAVKTWRCNPQTQDGEPVRAVASAPFNFTLK